MTNLLIDTRLFLSSSFLGIPWPDGMINRTDLAVR